MKKFFIYCFAAAMMAAVIPGCSGKKPAEPVPPEEEKPEEPEKPDKPEKPGNYEELVNNDYGIDVPAMEDYFAAVLAGRKAEYADPKIVEATDLKGVAQLVWDVWKIANAEFDEDKLPSLRAIDHSETAPVSGTWKLDSENMKFFYGYKGSKPRDGYPLFLDLHGSGDNQEEFDVTYQWAYYFDDAPSVYFIPRSPQGGTGCRWYQPTRQQAWERLFRQAFISGDIDPNRIYIFGISEGAYGSQRLASFYADYIAGAGPIAGGEQMFYAPPENCASIAFCLQTGEKDTWYGRKLLTQRAKEQFDSLQTAHPGYYVHKIDLQPDYDHWCDYEVTTPWLKDFTRHPHPKYVYWENLSLGNVNDESAAFRDGFYNLYVKERSTDDSDEFVRSCYEMNIEGNTVNLNVNVVTVQPGNYVTQVESDGQWQMNIGETKTYVPATKGRIVIYLNDELVDLSKPVSIVVNGKEKFNDTLTLTLKDIVTSCAEYFDPERLFPASIEITVE